MDITKTAKILMPVHDVNLTVKQLIRNEKSNPSEVSYDIIVEVIPE